MRILLIMLLTIAFLPAIQAQQMPSYLEGKVEYPVFDMHPWMGVIKVENPALPYDRSLDYKVVIDVYDKIKDSTTFNIALREAARVYNHNIVTGVPQNKLKMAVVIHGYAVYSLLNNDKYRTKYGVANPNLELIKRMKDMGVDLYVCGQNLGMMRLAKEDIASEVEVAISAKMALITLDQRGYTYLNVNED